MADYAVVVGVSHYPGLSDDEAAANLDGPNNDAASVYEWLLDPQGGRLQPANVRLIRASGLSSADPPDLQPTQGEVEQALEWIEEQTRHASGGRLYLYFSGHGFAPVLEEGALFTTEATQAAPHHVYAHAWLRWFRVAQRFQEFVLWMDCCMNYQQSIVPTPVILRSEIRNGIPGPAFVAVAAQTKSALEDRMSDGLVHGVFTWTLLRGLWGGAADEGARVTSESLQNFLHTSMPEFLPDDVKAATTVDLQPFIRAGDGMVFQRLESQPKYRVHLTVSPAAAGQQLRIWAGRPHTLAVSETLVGTEWTGGLVRGLYLAEVPEAGLRHGFAVTGTGDVHGEVRDQGPPVIAATGAEKFWLDVEAQNAAATITVTDNNFQRIFTGTGELRERDKPGLYKVRVEFARDIGTVSEEIVMLDRDGMRLGVAARPLPSPAPIPGSAFTHEAHVWPFAEAAARGSSFPEPASGAATISVLSRFWTEPEPATRPLHPGHPMQGLELVGSDGTLLGRMVEDCRYDDMRGIDPVAVWEREVEPGVYVLRQTLESGRTMESSIVACSDWITQLAIRRSTVNTSDRQHGGQTPIEDAAIFMRRAGAGLRPSGQDAVAEDVRASQAQGPHLPSAEQDAVIEAARLALAQGRNILGSGQGTNLQKLLLQDYDDPIAAIIGGHLLLMAIDADTEYDRSRTELFDATIERLSRLVGAWHPDIAALSLRCKDPALRTDAPFTASPMFNRSWQLITEASYRNPALVPAALWARVHASTSVGPLFAWAADEATRTVHAQQLTRWMDDYPTNGASDPGGPMASLQSVTAFPTRGQLPAGTHAMPAEIRGAGRRLGIPAAAAAALWEERTTGPAPR